MRWGLIHGIRSYKVIHSLIVIGELQRIGHGRESAEKIISPVVTRRSHLMITCFLHSSAAPPVSMATVTLSFTCAHA